ncbi:MAG: hypothetical protein FJ147_23370 [Deltaproteobacteria bacterium]|nr:hypothetical protein [Deltaproteobacteria bacterium]
MSDWNLFLFGVGVSFMCGIGALAPLLYAASKAELDWRARKRQNNTVAPLRPIEPKNHTYADDPGVRQRRA